MKQNLTTEQKIEKISADIEKFEANPVLQFYGQELGTAKLVRDGRTFRIFVKEVQPAKSGKATLVEMKVFVSLVGKNPDGSDKQFALVRGHTYLPNFVLENKDVYWILENKIHGKLSGFADDFRIDRQYVPKEFVTYGNYWSQEHGSSPEESANGHLEFLKNFRESFVKDLRLEVGISAFMEMVA